MAQVCARGTFRGSQVRRATVFVRSSASGSWTLEALDDTLAEASLAAPSLGSHGASSSGVAAPPRFKVARMSSLDNVVCESDAGASNVSEGSSGNGNGRGRPIARVCPGCTRMRGVSTCYVHPEREVEWGLANGRGSFCSDCLRVWRTLHSVDVTLTLYKEKLKDGEARRQHLMELVAFVSLLREGPDGRTITSAMLTIRIDTLKFVLHWLGIPSLPLRMVPLEELVPLTREGDKDDIVRRLITYKSGNVEKLGVLMPGLMDAHPDPPRSSFQKPRVFNHTPLFAGVACTNDRDIELNGPRWRQYGPKMAPR